MRCFSLLVAASLVCAAPPTLASTASAPPRPASVSGAFAGLANGQVIAGFRATALYRNAADVPFGARFVHAQTGFTLDVLAIDSVPQGFIWVNSWPTSDKGEPHTQEHLLLGKGNQGREVANLDSMSLADSSAYTEQRRTCYHFDTTAGPEAFYTLFERRMGALLHPDYTDEEIRREVRNFGVTRTGNGPVRLEEKGTVYNEMLSTFERPWTRAYHQMSVQVYGPGHPLSWVAGGSPEALRTLTPPDIRAFHDANYHLANMGMVASLPGTLALGDVLGRLGGALARVEPDGGRSHGPFKREADLPAPHGAPAGAIAIVNFPDKNADNPGQLLFSWPANLNFASNREYLLAELFMDAFAGDATTTLYKAFIDHKTRRMALDATGVFGYVDDDQGHPFAIGFTDVGAHHLTGDHMARVRSLVARELATVAGWPDGSPALAAFNARVRSLIRGRRRAWAKFVNSPPGFGRRGTNSAWIARLDRLDHFGGFEQSVTMDALLRAVERQVSGPQNLWRAHLAAWKLLDTRPYAVAARPDPSLAAREGAAHDARIASELAGLRARYHAMSDQDALARYAVVEQANTAELERSKAAGAPLHFIDHPPLGLDPDLVFERLSVKPGIPLVASTFEAMTSSTVGLALALDTVPERHLLYLSMLPTLLTQVGVIEGGRAMSYDEMTRRLRNEILGLNAYYSHNGRTRRAELVLSGAGNTLDESVQAVRWLERVAIAPDWRPENLPRLRDVVDQRIGALHQQMKGAEEHWVHDPANAFWRQDDPVLMATGSFLTQEHNAHRLRWQLKGAGTNAERQAIAAFLTRLASAPARADRAGLRQLAAALAGEKGAAPQALPAALAADAAAFGRLRGAARANAREAAKDLLGYLADLPDGSLAGDWRYLCEQMRADLLVGPQAALASLNATRRAILNAHNARMFMVGSSKSRAALLRRALPALAAKLAAPSAPKARRSRVGLVTARLRERVPGARPLFVGLVNPNTQSGVLLNTAPGPSYTDTDRASLLNLLASELYSGGGAHSMFMKTWAAGLAYSNGLRTAPETGQLAYYAERCPELPQTLGFVVDALKQAPRDPNLVEYAIALAFRDSRAAGSYEGRAEAMAANLADGLSPEVVGRFDRALLALRREPKLADALYDRLTGVYGRVLPGLGVKARDVPGAIYFAIGPDRQLALYERYLQATQGPDAGLYRLYPRDFWATGR